MTLLAIETSCDETAAAVVDTDGRLLASTVRSQELLHAQFGGVVPEVASRAHNAYILPIVDKALADAGRKYADLKAVAVTAGPGLLGSLLVGLSTAKALAFALKVPLVAVDHLQAHVAAAFIDGKLAPRFPMLALVVSGGHTVLYRIDDFGRQRILGATRDDAVGEAYDKVGALLQLGYPGGPIIDKLATAYQGEFIDFPVPMQHSGDLQFSFSGLKTAVVDYCRKHPVLDEKSKQRVAASFQKAAVTALVVKLEQALRAQRAEFSSTPIAQVVVCGGVACNSALRRALSQSPIVSKYETLIPEPRFCTDNAAMIAWLGLQQFKRGDVASLSLAPYASARMV